MERQKQRQIVIGIILLAAGVVGAVLLLIGVIPVNSGKMWLAGAAAIGLLGGYATGASEKAGTATEFTKLLGTGLIVPVLGGHVNLPKGCLSLM